MMKNYSSPFQILPPILLQLVIFVRQQETELVKKEAVLAELQIWLQIKNRNVMGW